MKVLLLLVFVGCASASLPDVFNVASKDVVNSFVHGMARATPLHVALGMENNEALERLERDAKEEIAKYLKDAFEKILIKIDLAVKAGKEINQVAVQKLKELKEQMNQLEIDDEDVEKIKDKLDDHLRQILEKMGILDDNKRAVHESMREEVFEDLNFRNFILKIKQMVLDNMDASTLKNSLAKVVGQASEKLCEWLTSKGKEKVLNFFDRVLDEDDKKRSVSDVYDQVQDYFRDLDLNLKEKFSKFGEWVKEVAEKGLDKSRTRIENVKAIAKHLLDESKVISKEVAVQALEYLKEYRQELGSLYDELRDKITQKISDYTD